MIESKTVYNFYKYWRKNCPLEITRPLDIIDYIIQQFNLNKAKNTGATKQLPNYITEFFNNIKFKIEDCDDKQQQKVVLKEYDNKQNFMEYLDQRINDSINRYFGFHICNECDTDDDTGFISD
jgi:predicted transcriptional regulator